MSRSRPIKRRPQSTEGAMLELLRRKVLADMPNGDQAAFLTHVPSVSGGGGRTIDALAMGIWRSRGLYLTAYEVKCSRSDWLREVRDPVKADVWAGLVDFFYVVVAGDHIVQEGELPSTWGLIVLEDGKRLRFVKSAPALRDLSPDQHGRRPLPPDLGRAFLAGMLRVAVRRGELPPEEVEAAVAEARERDRQAHEAALQFERDQRHQLEEVIRRFEQESGVRMSGWWGRQEDRPETVGRALRAVLDGDEKADRARERLEQLRDGLNLILDGEPAAAHDVHL